ncbi:MAG: chromosomal replication initiator protein DnaA [Oscillospiraceae bacterium]|nr:chromosomal replication initiator protein DnaA [Oscillospiraceae bacterium]
MGQVESFDQVFENVREYCKSQLSDVNYTLWIEDLTPLKFEGLTAYLKAKSKFKRNIIIEKYKDILLDGFSNVLGFQVDLVIEYDEVGKKQSDFENDTYENNLMSGHYEYTFDTFIVGPSNKFAHAASLAVATNPGNAYNPLFIYGDSGLGKTHLLYAISHDISKNILGKNIVFVKGDQFSNELIDAIKSGATKHFHDKYRSADVLLVDDIQFIAGKESTQEEFFHTFNTLFQDKKQIILTSDRPPKEIKTLEERLRTRFEWGLLADIQVPEYETRCAIIRRKAELISLKLPTEVVEYIANRLKTNIRQLEGTVKRIKAFSDLNKTPPSIMTAQNAIRDILNDNQPVPVTVERIINEVARTYGVLPADIRSSKRSSNISVARQVSAHAIREITQISYHEIGLELGGRDHSTIVYQLKQACKNIKKDPRYKETVDDIIRNIRGS